MPGPGPMPGPDGDCNDCVKTVTSYKTVQVPCTRNRYKVVNYTVPKTVPYQVSVPITKYKTINVPKTRQVCEPFTSVVSKQVPVVKVCGPPPPCPPPPCN